MNITVWGVRGSIPTTSPDTKQYGGDTSCIGVEAEGTLLVLDAGTGIQHLNGHVDLNRRRVDILLTHLHIDHIQGLGFFRPLFNPDTEVHIWGPASTTQSLRARLGRYLSPPLFPVYFRDLACRLSLHEVDHSSFTIGPFSIHSAYVTHPGPTVGYRVSNHSGVLAYIPDHEPVLGRRHLIEDVDWLSGSDLASGADLLLHDAQYTAEEYAGKVGWGHSSMSDAVQFAELTRVNHLLLTHHDPLHTDARLRELYRQLRAGTSSTVSYEMAVEGMRVDL
ncbi:MAG TPA: MBL fold metallo-hydrolase [Chitinophagaceae bacterium]